MRSFITASAILAAFTTPVLAQNPIATPVGKNFETQDGSDQLARGWRIGYAYNFANRASGHYQNIDDELNGKLRPIKSLAYRMDNTSQKATTAAGRSWANVTVKVAEVAYANISRTFSANLTNPATVFSGSVNWPSYTGWIGAARPPLPAAIQPAHTFPFTNVWIYTGTNAIVHDYVFTGGTLANNAAWTGTNTSYRFDGAIIVTSMGTGAARFPSNATCNDSAITGTSTSTAAQMVTQFNQYSRAFTGPRNNTIEVPIYSRYTAPNSTVIHGVGLAALNNGIGVPIGFGCNNLILDTSAFIQLLQTTGGLPRAESTRVTASAPRTPVTLGVDVWMQGVWADSKTGTASLTTASRARAPNLGMTETLPKKAMIWSASTTALTGSRTGDASWTSFPLTFYAQ